MADDDRRRNQLRDHVVAVLLAMVFLAGLLAVFAGAGFWPPGTLP